jgi:hypothetical protein
LPFFAVDWWRKLITSFIDSLFIEVGNTWPNLLMNSLLMEATNHLIYWCSLLMEVTHHLIYWCTLCWWRQYNTSFIYALFIDGGNKSPHLLMHSSLMEATKHLIYWCSLLMEAINHLIYWCTLCWRRQ